MEQVSFKSKILLVEDNTSLAENIGELLKINGYEVLGIFDSSENVHDTILESTPDLILIDIKLKGAKNGIELATEIRNEASLPIVFITSSSGKAIIDKVKHIKPDGFIVKPFLEETLITTLELAMANFNTSTLQNEFTSLLKANCTPDEIFIRENGWLKKVLVKDILWIKAEGTYTQLNVEGKFYTLRNTTREILNKLDENQFFRAHKSYIINLKKVEAFNSSLVKIGDSEIPIGRNYYKELVNLVPKINN